MSSHTVSSRFDECLERNGASLLRLTFLLSREKGAAEELAFQSLLRLAARPEADAGDDRLFLFSTALRLCEDWFSRKLRKKPRPETLRQAALPFVVTEDLIALLGRPFACRAAAALSASGFGADEIRRIAGPRAAREAEKLSPGALQVASSVCWGEGQLSQLSDRVYDRFSERSVGVENAIHEARIRFDRAAPYLALAVLLFFAFCVWFSARRG